MQKEPHDQLRRAPDLFQKVVLLETCPGRAPALLAQSLGTHTCPHVAPVPGVSLPASLGDHACSPGRPDPGVSCPGSLGHHACSPGRPVPGVSCPRSLGAWIEGAACLWAAAEVSLLEVAGPLVGTETAWLALQGVHQGRRDQELCSTSPPQHTPGTKNSAVQIPATHSEDQELCSTDPRQPTAGT